LRHPVLCSSLLLASLICLVRLLLSNFYAINRYG
jgi:hypothetical protein